MSIFIRKDQRELKELWSRINDLKQDRRVHLHVTTCSSNNGPLMQMFRNRYCIIVLKLDKCQKDKDLEIKNLTFREAMRYIDGFAMGHMYKSLQDIKNV